MKANRPSRTAEHNALFRAIEHASPLNARIVSDSVAEHFLTPEFRLVAKLSRIRFCATLLRKYIDFRWPGSRTSLIARTRLIDNYVASAVVNGVRQIVLLGAGFDSRAYRIDGADGARFFEVDHPSTSRVKQDHIIRTLGARPGHVRYVAVDFQRERLPESLQNSGFNPSERSLFVWEGVSNYLTEAAVRSTLSYIGSLSRGTALAFTYVDQAVLEAPTKFIGGSEVQKAFARLKEPWTFGIRPSEAAGFFEECGLELNYDLSAAEYRKQYYKSAAQIRGYEFYHLVLARVPMRAVRCPSKLSGEALIA